MSVQLCARDDRLLWDMGPLTGAPVMCDPREQAGQWWDRVCVWGGDRDFHGFKARLSPGLHLHSVTWQLLEAAPPPGQVSLDWEFSKHQHAAEVENYHGDGTWAFLDLLSHLAILYCGDASVSAQAEPKPWLPRAPPALSPWLLQSCFCNPKGVSLLPVVLGV